MGFELGTLGDYIKIQGGFAYKSKDFQDSGANKVLKIKNVRFGHVDYGDTAYISDTLAKETQAWSTNEGDVLISMTGSGPNAPQSLVGRVARVWENEDKAWINQRVGRIVLKKENTIHPDFVYYLLSQKSSQDFLVSNSSGSANQANISGKTIEMLPCPIVSFDESSRIASTLIALDKKILLNRQINQTLELMAQTLFKSWFVDFDPVMDNALDAGNLIPDELQHRALIRQEQRKAMRQGQAAADKESEGFTSLPDDVRQLFPDAFEESELGWVPRGWEIKSSGDMIDVRDGTHASPKKSEHGFPLVTSKNLTSGRLDLSNAYLISSEDYEEVNKRSKVARGDILLTMIGTLGVPCLISVSEVNFAIKNIGLFRTSQNPLFKNYFFELLKSREMQRYLDSRAAGTTQKDLSLKVLRNIPFLCPSDAVLHVFNQYAQMYESKVQQNTEQSEQLTKLRDTLLPRLISGELRLDDIEENTGEETVNV